MIRTCDGTDPNLIGIDGTPCKCARTFDDVRYMVSFPHLYIPSREEKEALFVAWGAAIEEVKQAWGVVQNVFKQTQIELEKNHNKESGKEK